MFSILQQFRRRLPDDGFSLIELMVVVLIIAILIGIAIPTFLGVRTSAHNRAAQGALGVVYTNALAIYSQSQDYTSATAGTIATYEPQYDYVAGTVESTGPEQISVLATSDEWHAAIYSNSGRCYMNRDQPNSLVVQNRARTFAWADDGDCTALRASTDAGLLWVNGWNGS